MTVGRSDRVPALATTARTVPETTDRQDRQWSRQAAKYDDLFLDPFRPGVENPLIDAIRAIPDPGSRQVADLGCGTGPLIPLLLERFAGVVALDFAPKMVDVARKRLVAEGVEGADRVRFMVRPMYELDELRGQLDVAIAVNSIVMPDVRDIDRTMAAIRAALKPGGTFLGILPSMDAIHYHTMLLNDEALDRGLSPEEAERHAAFQGEHHFYEFAFGRFQFRGLHQKFWQPFEAHHRLSKAGFVDVALEKVLYPWDDTITGGPAFADHPRSWDWFFRARAPE
ncbi:class I SAM-dependent methyltransferase [Tundrisphaera sp. TA3]|uniref:class I SAM-dependent methyltransferase n=1 Tax=Tundrisphaera sp. TA3 TaxID=3435775 RepID=UPI003EBB618F